ncbi:alpha/beta fold hydrolase [Granulicella aggregans]|nr:alpha/beta hydrolase [Granulicella aggregans]
MIFLIATACLGALAQVTTTDVSAHRVEMVAVEPGVKLEVLDWGGTGEPLVFLAGLGGTAHSFDTFAMNFTKDHHVYGITRRGYPASDVPEPVNDNYDSDRLGDDVLSVLTALKIERPVLAGHSFAGEEMSSIATRFPNRVAGLIYLDAANRYAFSPSDRGDFQIDTLELKRRLNDVLSAISPTETRAAIDAVIGALPQYEKDLQQQTRDWAHAPDMAPTAYADVVKERATPEGKIEIAALHGERRYTQINCPVLAIFALPHDHGLPPGPERDAADAWDLKQFGPLADSFEAGVPTARVVRIPHAQHAVYKSNEAEVVKEMKAFLKRLN